MAQNEIIPKKWHDLIASSLNSDNAEDRIFALDFLSQQTSLTLDISKEFMPLIVQSVVHPETKVRYFARRARNHILDCFPEIESSSVSSEPFKLILKEGEKLTPQQILLHKLRLGSRYLVFEAMERLTESGDNSLVGPLLEYLEQEKDEYKVSYLLRLLGRFDDKRIPEVLQKYLDHEDSRIVANSIEALCEFNVPELSSTFADFAMSNDNRVRCNAVRALYRYSPAIAEKHIAEMVNSNNIALQDSGVFLLRAVRPSNLGQLLDVANNSRYAAIRLKALDIMPPTKEEAQNAEMLLKEDIEQPDETRDLWLFTGFAILSVVIFVIVGANNREWISALFAVVGILNLIRPDKTRTSIQKTAISMCFIGSVAWESTRLMLLPALMGLWLTWNGSHFNQRGKLEKAKSASVYAWFFVIIAILLTQFIQGSSFSICRIAGSILDSSGLLDTDQVKDTYKAIDTIVKKQNSFEITIYVCISIMMLAIMKLDSWFPPKPDSSGTSRPSSKKRLAVATAICLALIILFNVFQVFGLNLALKTNGFKVVTDVLKSLLP